jgi:hypothetical protein
MSKGLNALEIVFGMFLLLIVVFVIIRLLTNFVTPSKVNEPLQNFDEAYKYDQEVSKCKDLCDRYTTEECRITAAVNYCLQKVKIDINGNKQTGEPNKGGFVTNLPYCEDGLYCFHIYDCKCGTYKLTPENCRKILCDYYIREQGLYFDPTEDPSLLEEVGNIITKGINFGTCNPDVNTWAVKNAPTTALPACWWTISAGFANQDCSPRIDPTNPDGYVCPEYLPK